MVSTIHLSRSHLPYLRASYRRSYACGVKGKVTQHSEKKTLEEMLLLKILQSTLSC